MSIRRLVIAEKNSVARSIAAVLGAVQKQSGYLEGNGYLVSWCVGHLVELAQASVYNTQYQKWRREDLPIMPCWGGRSNRTKRRNRGSGDSVLEASAGRAAAPKVRLEGLGCFPASTTGGFHASGNRLFSDFGAPKALLAKLIHTC